MSDVSASPPGRSRTRRHRLSSWSDTDSRRHSASVKRTSRSPSRKSVDSRPEKKAAAGIDERSPKNGSAYSHRSTSTETRRAGKTSKRRSKERSESIPPPRSSAREEKGRTRRRHLSTVRSAGLRRASSDSGYSRKRGVGCEPSGGESPAKLVKTNHEAADRKVGGYVAATERHGRRSLSAGKCSV